MLGSLYDVDRAVVVAVISMGVMKTPVDKVVDMVPVRDRFMAAAGTMHVPVIVLGMGDAGAPVGVFFGHR